jgi:DNA-binding XRE family transcriptional regulator
MPFVLPPKLPKNNRIVLIMAHTVRYAFHGLPLLAKDTGIARSTMYRLAKDEILPTLAEATKIVEILSEALEKEIPVQEVFTTTGTYPTASGCILCDCQGCRPDWVYTPSGKLRPEHKAQKTSDWSLSQPSDESLAPR